MNLKAVRFNQRRENYVKSLRLLLNQSKKEELSDENIGATLHFYEMTFELSWKLLKDFLEVEGVIVKSPRETIKTAFSMGYLTDGNLWLEMLDARNSIAHTYQEEVAQHLFQQIKANYLPELLKLEDLQCSD